MKADGLAYDPESIRIVEIREGREYHGQRISLSAYLGQTEIKLRFDIGFGDTVIPRPIKVKFPSLLNFPLPECLAYPKETVISEKLQIMVELGIANSRMKDYYDLYVLTEFFDFQGPPLINAIRNTFKKRKTEIPLKQPVALSNDFINDDTKKSQWKAFIKVNNVHHLPDSLAEIISRLSDFLLPPLKASLTTTEKWKYHWKSGGRWTEVEK